MRSISEHTRKSVRCEVRLAHHSTDFRWIDGIFPTYLIAIKINKIDLIIMNNAPLSINHEVIKEGQLIICKDNSEKNNFETYIMSRYLDMKYFMKNLHQLC